MEEEQVKYPVEVSWIYFLENIQNQNKSKH